MTVSDALRFHRDVYEDWRQERAVELLDLLRIPADLRIREASSGQAAKIKLILAMARKARYVLLDEPLAGIDPLAREDAIGIVLREFREERQTIVLTTHEIRDVEHVLDDIAVLNKGELMLQGELDALRAQRGSSLYELLKGVYRDAAV